MKKVGLILLTLMLSATLAACGGDKKEEGANTNQTPTNTATEAPTNAGTDTGTAEAELKDGAYYAEGTVDEKSGWQYVVALKVENGKITNVNWNGLNKNGGLDKKALSESGEYGMVEKGKAVAEWHEQAATMEQFVIDKQSVADIAVNEEGKTDAVSGVSITVSDFAKLVDDALKAGPVEAGAYKDGHYKAEAADFDEKSGWKATVDVTVMNGKIAAVRWNGVHKDGGTDKVTRSTAGEYGMKEHGKAVAEWHEQAALAEKFLLEKQDPAAIAIGDGGKTDAISGVTIAVSEFTELASKALEGAK
ncbi:FMN-binding protein [Paenibacillus yanchengensis]|uniref:FMN-binding protein n=1 Tax=Paenibacillus yanchengensis TaxID=2035833 RepID=A0ABW4YPN1_9BACL